MSVLVIRQAPTSAADAGAASAIKPAAAAANTLDFKNAILVTTILPVKTLTPTFGASWTSRLRFAAPRSTRSKKQDRGPLSIIKSLLFIIDIERCAPPLCGQTNITLWEETRGWRPATPSYGSPNRARKPVTARHQPERHARRTMSAWCCRLVRQHGSLAKSDIARMTKLSAQTVSVIMRELEQDGLLLRAGAGARQDRPAVDSRCRSTRTARSSSA